MDGASLVSMYWMCGLPITYQLDFKVMREFFTLCWNLQTNRFPFGCFRFANTIPSKCFWPESTLLFCTFEFSSRFFPSSFIFLFLQIYKHIYRLTTCLQNFIYNIVYYECQLEAFVYYYFAECSHLWYYEKKCIRIAHMREAPSYRKNRKEIETERFYETFRFMTLFLVNIERHRTFRFP